MPVGGLFMIALLLALVGAVAMLIIGGKRVRVAAVLMLLGVPALLLAMLFGLRVSRHSEIRARTSASDSDVAVSVTGSRNSVVAGNRNTVVQEEFISGAGRAASYADVSVLECIVPQIEWTVSGPKGRLADVYPSMESAAVALTQALLDSPASKAIVPPSDDVRSVRVCGDGEEAVLGRVADLIRSRFGQNTTVQVTTGYGKTNAPDIDFTVGVGSGAGWAAEGDSLMVRLIGPDDRENTMTAEWVNRPWIENPVEFRNAKRGDSRNWVIGRSNVGAHDAETAMQWAMENAAEKFAEVVRAEAAQSIDRYPSHTRTQFRNASDRWLRDQIVHVLGKEKLVDDRFVQSCPISPDNPDRRAYRGAVLIGYAASTLTNETNKLIQASPNAPTRASEENWSTARAIAHDGLGGARSWKTLIAVAVILLIVYLLLRMTLRKHEKASRPLE